MPVGHWLSEHRVPQQYHFMIRKSAAIHSALARIRLIICDKLDLKSNHALLTRQLAYLKNIAPRQHISFE